MHREYQKWFSPSLGRDMEMLIFGHGGQPVLVFPTSMGRFFEYEDRGMINTVRGKVENGETQFFCVDSVDKESWYNRRAHPSHRVLRHIQYEQYLLSEVLPLIRHRNHNHGLTTTGASFGGYHSFNFAMKHPDIVTRCISMSGAFDIHQFVHGYWDDNCYFNCPPDYLSNLNDDWFLGRYRGGLQIVLAAGDRDICLRANQDMSGILSRKGIPHFLDIWGGDSVHDWPLWERMMQKFL